MKWGLIHLKGALNQSMNFGPFCTILGVIVSIDPGVHRMVGILMRDQSYASNGRFGTIVPLLNVGVIHNNSLLIINYSQLFTA